MRYFCFSFTVLTCFVYSMISGFQLIPVTAHIDPAKPKKLFYLVNKDDFQKAIEVSIVKRVQNIDGEETLEAAEEEFQVYPSQVILAPHSRQVVHVSWLGTKEVSEELAYRIIAEELPVDLEQRATISDQHSALTILMRYEGTLYVASPQVAPQTTLQKVETQVGEDGTKELVITLRNEGSCHEILNAPRLVLTPVDRPDQQVVLEGEALEKIKGRNILRNSERRFVITYPDTLADTTLKGEFKGNA